VTRCRSYTTEPSTKPRQRIGREHFRRNRTVIVGVHYTVRQRLLKRVFERRVSLRITLTERTSRQWDIVSPRRILVENTQRIPDYRTLQKTTAYSTEKSVQDLGQLYNRPCAMKTLQFAVTHSSYRCTSVPINRCNRSNNPQLLVALHEHVTIFFGLFLVYSHC
jgi:hypothetical protein